MAASMLVRLSLALGAWLPSRADAAWRYALIVDAGSSGSRMRMYNMTDSLRSIFPRARDEPRFEIEPGLSEYADDPGQVIAALEGLLRAATEYIPRAEWGRAALWVKATAGMRMMPQEIARKCFRVVDAYLSKPVNCPFRFISSEVLGGEEEALFAYLSINSIIGTKLTSANRVGILDLGGASLQIAHKPSTFILANEFSFYVHQERRSVYAKSFLQFGLQTAVQRAKRQVLEQAGRGAKEVNFPCFNRGYSETLDGVRFVGSPDDDACANLTRSLLRTDYECVLEPCPMMGVHVSPFAEDTQFYGLCNFFYVPHAFGLIGWHEAKKLEPIRIRKAVEAHCKKSSDEAKMEKSTPWKYKRHYCFGGHYVYQILRAFGFRDNSTSIMFARKFRGQQADWSLGSALYETRYMPVQLQSRIRPCRGEQNKWEVSTIITHEASTQSRGVPLQIMRAALAALPFMGIVGLLVFLQRRRRARRAVAGNAPDRPAGQKRSRLWLYEWLRDEA